MKLDKKIIVKYENQWIAVDSDQSIVASNKNLDELQKKLKKQKIKGATILFIPSINTILTPVALYLN